MTRAFNSKRLPSFLGRGHLAALIKKGAAFDSTTRKKVYANLAEQYKNAGDQNKWKAYENLAGLP